VWHVISPVLLIVAGSIRFRFSPKSLGTSASTGEMKQREDALTVVLIPSDRGYKTPSFISFIKMSRGWGLTTNTVATRIMFRNHTIYCFTEPWKNKIYIHNSLLWHPVFLFFMVTQITRLILTHRYEVLI